MVIRRLPAPEDGSTPKTSSAVALLLVLAVVIGIWLINGRDPGTGTSIGEPIPVDTSTTAGESTAVDPDPDPDPDPERDAGRDPESGLAWVDLTDLPREAAVTVALIDRGPPYPYAQDGSTFGNVEGLLPDHERGYYEEFTVRTPGSDDRGARRVVAGAADELYWTADHYTSFERIRR